MPTSIQNTQGSQTLDFSALTQLAAQQLQTQGKVTVPGSQESARKMLDSLMAATGNSLPVLEQPRLGASSGTSGKTGEGSTFVTGGLTMGGLSLETLLDAVGFEQRRTETKAGIASLEAHAQERAQATEEKLKSIQEQLEKAKSQSFLDGLLKAFKYIGLALAAVASVAMIAAGAVGVAAGGSGMALIAVGVASMALLASSITEEATGGKAGFSPAFIIGKIMDACGASESATTWTKMAVDLLTSAALIALSFGTGAAGTASKAVGTAVKAASKSVETFEKAASITARVATGLGGANTIAQSATSIASASNQKDISFLQAQQKRLQAILERIAMANDLDIEHLKEMMQRSEQTLQAVSDIVQEGAQTNAAILAGNPAMA